MCLTVEYYEIGFCSECRVRSAAFERDERMCTPEFFEPESDIARNIDIESCLLGFEKKEIRWRWANPATEAGILSIHCIRCFWEPAWGDFFQRFVSKETDVCWTREPNHELITYFEAVPQSLHPDRWWQRTMRWFPCMARRALGAPGAEDEDIKTILKYPDTAKYVLLGMERLPAPPDGTWDQFRTEHPFPLWWYGDNWQPPYTHPPGAPLTVFESQMGAWDNAPHPHLDSRAWLPHGRRYRTFDGNNDPLVEI